MSVLCLVGEFLTADAPRVFPARELERVLHRKGSAQGDLAARGRHAVGAGRRNGPFTTSQSQGAILMTKRLIAIAIASIGLAAAGAYANEGHMHKQQSSSDQSSTSPSAQSSGHETAQQSAQAQDSDTVKKVQAALTQQGYNPGPADGQLGTKTEAALK